MTLASAPALRDWIPATRALTIGGQLVAGEGGSIDVFNPAVEKRLIARTPDWPAQSLRQLSAAPTPSEVTMPRPVTATATAFA